MVNEFGGGEKERFVDVFFPEKEHYEAVNAEGNAGARLADRF